mmetsp:Transcript_91389/g.274462  ORF Transcript_91389/g.274462 Transcript_91389/m.274462 type:complete len:87 (+) Transcript_91389:2-262(+)
MGSTAAMAYADYHQAWYQQFESERKRYEAAVAARAPHEAGMDDEYFVLRAFDQHLLDAADAVNPKQDRQRKWVGACPCCSAGVHVK